VPIQQSGDVEAVLAYCGKLRGAAEVQLAFLYVASPSDPVPGAGQACNPEALIERAEARCRAASVSHQSFILAGELVFSILDAAELLACAAIVMRYPRRRPWHHFFSTHTVRQVARLSRDVPLVIIDANGVVLRSKCA
jgi:nucleotide-binding universal stress UspA family protein